MLGVAARISSALAAAAEAGRRGPKTAKKVLVARVAPVDARTQIRGAEPMPVDAIKYRAVVSDLHIGEGGDLENFVYERAFLSFMPELARRGAEAGGRAELILNGDIVDFLQIAPLAPGDWRLSKDKLEATFAAHPQVFDELGRFV